MSKSPTLDLGKPPKFSRAEAAAYLGMSESFLKKLRGEKKGPALFASGRLYVYRREDLDAFAAAHRVEAAALPNGEDRS